VTLLKEHNHVYRLDCSGDTYFLKSYTKDWYAGDVASTAFCVDHEATAWRILAAHGLPVPEVVIADQSLSNPLNRPYIVTRALQGSPLTTLLQQASPSVFKALLRAVGRYLARMHAITFPYPGYLSSMGPSGEPDPDAWQHPIWTWEGYHREALATWEQDRLTVPNSLLERVTTLWSDHAAELAGAFRPPRFTHGDCHPHQFFLHRGDEGWQVSGVVDMEVASAGDAGADWVKLVIEMAGFLPASARWWEPLFEGYGHAPTFSLLKLRLLATAHINYTCLGERSWPGTRADILSHLLNSPDWYTLFDTSRI
jgi:aminoglycoside phosphotransferase (APT) family kinase protein